ncbi:MAG: type II secretion system F family protein [Oscillospiraceae bacterium]|nr:type II secretion system F family protein [Oscillospiraceae bacterium]
MPDNFTSAPAHGGQNDWQTRGKIIDIPNYSVSPSKITDHILAFAIGFAASFAVVFIFYKILPLSLIAGGVFGVIFIYTSSQGAIAKRKLRLRVQFFDMLEAMSVAMRAGNPPLKALESSREDLSLLYAEDSDIITELDIIIARFNNATPLSEVFADFAKRSGLEDIDSFASIYATIEGKSSRADEIVRETQQIIADKMEIEMEIDTMMTEAKSEVNIMLFMPLVILGIVGYAGAGFMDAIYTTTAGRIVSTAGLIVFIVSFIMARKFSSVKL